jgi:CIC family chloride channel protein
VNMLLPLLIATTIAHAFTVLVMRRSILTEKLSRRGFHLSREYEVDPLETLSVGETMTGTAPAMAFTADMQVAFADETLRTVVYRMAEAHLTELPVVEREHPGKPVGSISLHDLLQARVRNLEEETRRERHLNLSFNLFSPE